MDETAEGTPDKAGDEQTQFAWQVEDEDARHLRDGVEADEAQFSWQVGEDTAPVESEVRETPDYTREAVAEPVVQPAVQPTAEPVAEPAPAPAPESDMDFDDSEFDSDRDAVHLVDGEPVGEVPEEYAAPEDTTEPVVDVEPEPVAPPAVEPAEVYEAPNTPESTDAPEPLRPGRRRRPQHRGPERQRTADRPVHRLPRRAGRGLRGPNTPETTDEPIRFDAHAGADTAVLGAAAATAGAAAGARVGSDQALLYDGLNTLADYEFHPRRRSPSRISRPTSRGHRRLPTPPPDHPAHPRRRGRLPRLQPRLHRRRGVQPHRGRRPRGVHRRRRHRCRHRRPDPRRHRHGRPGQHHHRQPPPDRGQQRPRSLASTWTPTSATTSPSPTSSKPSAPRFRRVHPPRRHRHEADHRMGAAQQRRPTHRGPAGREPGSRRWVASDRPVQREIQEPERTTPFGFYSCLSPERAGPVVVLSSRSTAAEPNPETWTPRGAVLSVFTGSKPREQWPSRGSGLGVYSAPETGPATARATPPNQETWPI
ncbi:hypothetical protein QP028_12685 [Corynebacterium suedekumii]|nr:hypothetical protein QP028_12685 [Corynebacterium suedekumii]